MKNLTITIEGPKGSGKKDLAKFINEVCFSYEAKIFSEKENRVILSPEQESENCPLIIVKSGSDKFIKDDYEEDVIG
jgi:hypothetical protein